MLIALAFKVQYFHPVKTGKVLIDNIKKTFYDLSHKLCLISPVKHENVI